MRRIGFLLLAFYIVFLGGSSYYYQVFSIRAAHHVIITIVLLVWLLARIIKGRGLPPSPLNPLIYAAVGMWLLTSAVALDARIAFESTWFLINHALILLVFIDMIQRGRGRLLMETQLMIGAVVVFATGFQTYTWLFGSGDTHGWINLLGSDMSFPPVLPRLDQPFGVSTWLSAYTAPLVTLAITYALTVRRRDYKPALWGLAVALFVIMFLSSSRGGLLSLAVAIVTLIGFRLWDDKRIPRLVFMGAGVIIVSATAAVILLISRDPSRIGGDLLRMDLWRSSVEMFMSDPVSGVGVGNFGRALREVRDPSNPDDRLSTAHNVYLNTAAETGILGVIVGAGCIGVIGLAWFRQWKKTKNPARRLRLEGVFAALIGMAVHSAFDMFTITALVTLALVMIAFCITPPRTVIDPPLKGDRIPAYVSIILLALFGGFLTLISDRAHTTFNTSVSAGDLASAQTAAQIDPSLRLYPLQIEYLSAKNASDPQTAITAYQRALELEPTWDTGWINLAHHYELRGEYTSALDALERAGNINATNGAWFGWARIAEAHNLAEPEAIINAYIRSITFPPDHRAFWTETELRRQAVRQYADTQYPEVRLRTYAAIFPDEIPSVFANWQGEDGISEAENNWVRAAIAYHTIGNNPQSESQYGAMLDAINAAIAAAPSRGDIYVMRSQIRAVLEDMDGARLDLERAALIGVYYERDAIPRLRIAYAETEEERREMIIRALSIQAISQNFEGVLFQGRRADFRAEARMITPGDPFVDVYFELADYFLSIDDTPNRAIQVYRLILERAPFNERAREALTAVEAGE